MDPVSLVLCAGLFVITVLILLTNRKSLQFAYKINKVPGPKTYPIFGNSLIFFFLKRNEVFTYVQKEFHSKYKRIFRTWFGKIPQIHLQRPEDVEVILRSSDHIDKGVGYKNLHEWLGTGLLTSTGQKWHSHRKMITPTFHFKILDTFLEVFSENSEILVRKMRKEVGSQGFDVYPYITKCALDIICETAMGTSVYAQDDRGAEYVKAVYDIGEISLKRSRIPFLNIKAIFTFSKLGRRHAHCLKILHGFTNKVIAERKNQILGIDTKSGSLSSDEDASIGKKKRKAFLDLLLEASKDDVKLTDEELREEVDTFMFEGHDTTSTGMCWALFLMGLHQDVQEKAYEEQNNIFQGSDRAPNMKDLNEMKYLERVIKESLRVYPSVPVIARKLNSDTNIGGYDLPAGCTVALHIYNVHRNPDHFPNPEVFNPDNFLPERTMQRHPYAYIPFSAGPRNCIGQKFALLEEKTVLSYILRNYKFKSLETREDITLIGELILRPEKGIKLIITPRGNISDD